MQYFNDIEEGLNKINEGLDIVKKGPLSFYLKKMKEANDLLFNRFCPWKIGDRVVLVKTPVITEEGSPGWLHCRHFLIAGATGLVETVDCNDSKFYAGIKFDNETYRDGDGNLHLVVPKHHFRFAEDFLVKIQSYS